MGINNESKRMSLLIPRSFCYNRNKEPTLNVELCFNFVSNRRRRFTSDTGNFVNDNTIFRDFPVHCVTNRQWTMMMSLKHRKLICCLVEDRSWIPITEEYSFSASISRLTAAHPFSYPIRPHFSPYTVLPILQKLLHTTSHMGNLKLPFDD
jgi:hypothetical protein